MGQQCCNQEQSQLPGAEGGMSFGDDEMSCYSLSPISALTVRGSVLVERAQSWQQGEAAFACDQGFRVLIQVAA